MNNNRVSAIEKILSRNDTGETGGHQAGTLVPKQNDVLSFFPPLDASVKNPRHFISFTDPLGEKWTFSFIYYNNKFFNGTRNEYRLTRMVPFFKAHNLLAGDTLYLRRNEDGMYLVEYARARDVSDQDDDEILYLRNTWKVVNI